MTALVAAIGRALLRLTADAGGMTLLGFAVLRSVVTLRLDARELLRHLKRMGFDSLPIVFLTAFFTGGIMVVQSGIFVRRFGAYGLLGYAGGFATLREVGPILIGLMFSGRVGANNAAELGTMTVTEQVDGLRALALSPVDFLVAPRVVAMIIALFCLTLIGDAVAMGGGVVFGKLLLAVEPGTFAQSFRTYVKLDDLLVGLYKAAAFGVCISLSSCHFGLTVRGGAVGVGRAVNDAVVAAAIAIVVTDNFMTMVLK